MGEVNASVDTTSLRGRWRRIFAFMGPAYLIAVGYMDPGNWATDIEGGSRFGYALIWVLLMSNLMALLLQSLSARLGVVRGLDLAQASRATYPKSVNIALYLLAEIAIAACDLAEVLGMAIGLKLLFHLPVLYGVSITVLDSFLLLFLLNYGIRKMEAFILCLVFIIGMSFFIQMMIAQPPAEQIITGLIPSLPGEGALLIAIGIIGATVMPHNLYLHSSLVQTRKIEKTHESFRRAIKYNTIDSAIALNLAFFVNASILILAATTFFSNGYSEVKSIEDAHQLLEPLLGSALAPLLFAIALIASGQSSTITGTLAGQIIMEGYLNLRIQPWIRRLLTRLIAVVPAFIAIWFFGEGETEELLILSQVILSLQLGFAVIPLIHFVSDKEKMNGFAIGRWTQFGAWLSAAIIVGLNVRLVFEKTSEWIAQSSNPFWLWITLVPILCGAMTLLFYITLMPLVKRRRNNVRLLHERSIMPETVEIKPYTRIAIAVDFSETDKYTISTALRQGGKDCTYILIHVVESAGAHWIGSQIQDFETREDMQTLNVYADSLRDKGFIVEVRIDFGNPSKRIPVVVKESYANLLVMGAHGHSGLRDVLFGTTVNRVRHRVNIPVLIARA